MTDRVCNECGKTIAGNSYVRQEGGFLCGACYKRLIWRPRGGEAVEREREALKVWKAAHGGTCEKCGAPTTGRVSGKRKPGRWCVPCGEEVAGARAAAHMKDKHEPRRQRIVALWNDGLTLRQIAAEVGSTKNSVGTSVVLLRKQGYDLPYRRTPEQVERIRAGTRVGMAA